MYKSTGMTKKSIQLGREDYRLIDEFVAGDIPRETRKRIKENRSVSVFLVYSFNNCVRDGIDYAESNSRVKGLNVEKINERVIRNVEGGSISVYYQGTNKREDFELGKGTIQRILNRVSKYCGYNLLQPEKGKNRVL